MKSGVNIVSLAMQAIAPPLYEDDSGALRVNNTRVLLELVIRAYQDGDSPESIVSRYPTLNLSDVYAVITYFLHNRSEVERYLDEREKKAEEIHEKVITQQGDLSEIRDRINALRKNKSKGC